MNDNCSVFISKLSCTSIAITHTNQTLISTDHATAPLHFTLHSTHFPLNKEQNDKSKAEWHSALHDGIHTEGEGNESNVDGKGINPSTSESECVSESDYWFESLFTNNLCHSRFRYRICL